MPYFKRRPLAAAVMVMFTGPCVALAAGEASEELPTLTVTAPNEGYKADQASSPKFTQPLLDTTQTITVIPAELMRDQGAATLRDALRNTPGITFQAGEGGGGLPGDQNFTMRGFSARNALTIDGVRDTGTYARDTFVLESVEVAKGPSSTISGRSSTGGSVNQVTKSPRLDAFSNASIGLGTDSYKRVTADLNRPISDDAAVRLNLMYHDADVAGRDVVTNNRWGVAPSVAFGLGTPTRVIASFMKIHQDNVPDYGLPFNPTVDVNGDGLVNGGTAADGSDGIAMLDNDDLRSNFYGLENYDFENIDTNVGTLQLEHDINDSVSFRSVLRYVDTLRDSAITAPRPPNRQLQRRNMGNTVLANNNSLSFAFDTGSVHHDLVTGLELSVERTKNRNGAQTTNQPQLTDPLNPDPSQAPLGPMPTLFNTNRTHAEVDNMAVYLFDTLTLSESWEVNGGARFDNYNVSYEVIDVNNDGVDNRVDQADDGVLTSSESTLTWQAGIAYKPRPNGTVYVGYSTSVDPSFDAATTGLQLSDAVDGNGVPTNAANPSLDPEETRNIELGTKWDLLNEKLSLTAAIFRTEKTNARTTTGNNQPIILSGKQVVDGIELGATGNITDAWQIFAGATWMDTSIESSAVTTDEGNALTLTPETSYNLWTTYRLPFGLTVGGGVQYMDNVYRNTANTTSAPSYTLVSATASYPVSDNVTLRLNVDNVTDEAYIGNVGGGHFIPGPGRSAFVTADLSF